MTETPSGELDDGYIPPDPDEPRPIELWAAVGDVRPWGSLMLMLSWAIIALLITLQGGMGTRHGFMAWGASATGLPPLETAWRLLASTFLHDGLAHLFFNASSMLIFGPAVERIFTRSGLWLVFVVGGSAASIASLMWRTSHFGGALSLSVGASGAIFALGGALLVAAIRLRTRLAPSRARALGAALLYLVVGGFASGFTRLGTDNVAHGAGLACGALLGALLPLDARLAGRGPGPFVRTVAVAAAVVLWTCFALALRSGLGRA